MGKELDKSGSEPDPRDCATAWFAVLERAREDNDFIRAAEAMRQLNRLGVTVKFHRRAQDAQEVSRG